MNYYERHIGDYIKDTVSLTMTEDGAYNRLLDQCYQTEKPLPLAIKEIYREARANTTAERNAVDYVLSKFFEKRTDGYYQKRVEAEIERFQDKQRKAKASAEARWSKERLQSERNANASETIDAKAMRTHSEGNALQTPDTRHQKEDRNTARRSAPTCPKPSDVDDQTWADWTALRKGKKAAVSVTVIDGARHEAEKAGMSLEAFLRVWCVRGSQGLQADWLKPHEISGRQMESTISRENRERVAAFTGGKASARPLITIEAEHGKTPFALG